MSIIYWNNRKENILTKQGYIFKNNFFYLVPY